jgi:hypothetical protein
MNIPQPEHGGNGESNSVVNQWLVFDAAESRKGTALLLQIISRLQFSIPKRNPFDCAAWRVVLSAPGAKGRNAMVETVSACLGLISAGIFLAHAFEGFRSN